jgi:hypothetical protein
LALEVCSGIENFSAFCPGHEYRKIVMRASSLLGVTNQGRGEDVTEAEADMQSVLDLIHESGFEWPESLYGMSDDINLEWTA